jgi:hypothetical protein
MKRLLVFLAASSCVIEPVDVEGKACDAVHPCSPGRVCSMGRCISSSAAGGSSDPGGGTASGGTAGGGTAGGGTAGGGTAGGGTAGGGSAGGGSAGGGTAGGGTAGGGTAGGGSAGGGIQCEHVCVDWLCGLKSPCGNICTTDAGCREGDILDRFTDAPLWQVSSDSSSSLDASVQAPGLAEGFGDLQLRYSVVPGGYGAVEQYFAPGKSLAFRQGLLLWVFGDGRSNALRIELYDRSFARFEQSFVVRFTGWRAVYFPFSSFTRSGFQVFPDAGTLVPDLSLVNGLSISPAFPNGTGEISLGALFAVTREPVTAIVPLYIYPSSGAWMPLVDAVRQNPGSKVVAIINPNSGPGVQVSADYTNGIRLLEDAGIAVSGYVATTYAARAAAAVEADIRLYRQYYPQVSSIFLDEMSNMPSDDAYYASIRRQALDAGFQSVIGNPGTNLTTQSSLDSVTVFEQARLPTDQEVASIPALLSRQRVSVLVYDATTLPRTSLFRLRSRVGGLYFTQDTLPNPWDSLPVYLETMLHDFR